MLVEFFNDLVLDATHEVAYFQETLDVFVLYLEPLFTSGDLLVRKVHLPQERFKGGRIHQLIGRFIHLQFLSDESLFCATTDARRRFLSAVAALSALQGTEDRFSGRTIDFSAQAWLEPLPAQAAVLR